jgi:UDP-3-O-[3-hydroxymyristoyl] glucosamine N-acyltransferase
MLGAITTNQLARLLDAELRGPGDIDLSDIAGIDDAGPGCLTFIRSAEYARRWSASRASAAIVTRTVVVPDHDASQRALLLVEDADRALVALLAELQRQARPPATEPGVHPDATIDPRAEIHPTASVGPRCVVGPGASVGPGAVLHANVTLGPDARIGARTVLHPGVVVYHACVVGEDCLIHAGVVIGADGFGFIPHPEGRGLVKVPHLSNAIIGDNVEIGANTCIDRGKFRPTTVGDGTKIDNLVQVGHNVTIGPHAIVCGQSGLGGSCSVGAGAVLGGQVGVRDNTRVGQGARVGGQSGVMRDIPDGQAVFGSPARPSAESFRVFRAPDRHAAEIKAMRKRIRQLEARLGEEPIDP